MANSPATELLLLSFMLYLADHFYLLFATLKPWRRSLGHTPRRCMTPDFSLHSQRPLQGLDRRIPQYLGPKQLGTRSFDGRLPRVDSRRADPPAVGVSLVAHESEHVG
jgi:hypothetical protein